MTDSGFFFLVCIDIDVYNITRKKYSPVSHIFIDLSRCIKKKCVYVHKYIYTYINESDHKEG